ncbi:MAG: MFS transporter [Candidatus Pacebacteria bacterium]|nr:MFS transporter [Candidatus Paceibacterota bacterium]
MFTFPKIEKISRDATLIHFFLMFGYKLFSFYFPLYLVAKSFSIYQVGYTSFLIYLPIALFAPVVGFLNHRINPAILTAVGILGYAVYSLGMIMFQNMTTFYFFQILLGISASLFFVSSRAILMGSKLENPDRAFAWFYSAPSYADAIAPAVGALLIWKFNFLGVFILSLILQFFNAIFCFLSLRKKTGQLTEKIKIQEVSRNYSRVLEKIKYKNTLPYILVSFFVLILAGFNNTFFVLFLKNLDWSQNQILIFNSVLSLAFLPFSLWAIKRVARFKSEINICQGSQITGIFAFVLGSLASVLNFYSTSLIMLGSYLGGLMTFSGRSGLMTTKLKEYPEESAAVDTVFSPLATAVGALAGGLIIGPFGYPLIFILSGIFIFFSGTLAKRFAKNENLS